MAVKDWPTYRGDAGRTGFTENSLPQNLSLGWVYTPKHKPNPSWPDNVKMNYDHAFQTVISEKILYFCSSADNKIYALNIENGKELWSYFTDAPSRFAPVIWKNSVIFGSDDGFLYSLQKKTGILNWKIKAGKYDDRIFGNDRIISRWPIRGGVVVYNNIIYFAAGLWPSEGVFVYAVNPLTGKIIWENNTSGDVWGKKPRIGYAKSGPASQGYLAVNENIVVMPTGRAAPAVFDRKTGKFKYFHHHKQNGGTNVSLFKGFFISRKNYPAPGVGFYSEKNGLQISGKAGMKYAAKGALLYSSSKRHGLIAVDLNVRQKDRVNRKNQPEKYLTIGEDPVWKYNPGLKNVHEMIIADDNVIIGGDNGANQDRGYISDDSRINMVKIVNILDKKVIQSFKVDSMILGLSVADNKLFVSTRSGRIFCFNKKLSKQVNVTSERHILRSRSPFYQQFAREILQKTGVSRGICLDIDCESGELIYEMALLKKNMHFYGVSKDLNKVAQARKFLDSVGLYGQRATIHHVKDLNSLPYAGKMAELVVSAKSLRSKSTIILKTLTQMMSPYLGVSCLKVNGEL